MIWTPFPISANWGKEFSRQQTTRRVSCNNNDNYLTMIWSCNVIFPCNEIWASTSFLMTRPRKRLASDKYPQDLQDCAHRSVTAVRCCWSLETILVPYEPSSWLRINALLQLKMKMALPTNAIHKAFLQDSVHRCHEPATMGRNYRHHLSSSFFLNW